MPRDVRWGRTYEGYAEDPSREVLGAAAVQGFAGSRLADPLSVVACAKHYLADGGTAFGTITERTCLVWIRATPVATKPLCGVHLAGLCGHGSAGVATIMPSYSSWNGVKCSANEHLLTDILKHELGFEGFLISDYNAIDQMGPDYKKDIETSINAGMDMVMLTTRYGDYCQMLKELVNEGKVPLSRIDDAVTRILRVKFAMGLMDRNRPPLADRRLWGAFGSAEHRVVARQAVRETLVS